MNGGLLAREFCSDSDIAFAETVPGAVGTNFKEIVVVGGQINGIDVVQVVQVVVVDELLLVVKDQRGQIRHWSNERTDIKP